MKNNNQGLYFIYEKDILVYVGKTTNITNRIRNHEHLYNNRKYKFLPITNKADMALLELAYIDKFKPKYNKLDKFKENATIIINLPSLKTIKFKNNPGKTGGMRLVRTHTLCTILPEVVSSRLDMIIVAYMLKYNTNKGEVREEKSSKPASINYLADHLKTTRKKISQVVKRMMLSELLRKNKRILVLNPHIISPHAINNEMLFILQTYWNSKFTYDITEELEAANKAYQEYLITSKPEAV